MAAAAWSSKRALDNYLAQVRSPSITAKPETIVLRQLRAEHGLGAEVGPACRLVASGQVCYPKDAGRVPGARGMTAETRVLPNEAKSGVFPFHPGGCGGIGAFDAAGPAELLAGRRSAVGGGERAREAR